MSRGRRQRVATGIYQDAHGLSAIVTVRGRQQERRFPPGTSLTVIRGVMRQMRRALETATPRAPRGTLRHCVDAYLSRLPNGRYREDRRGLLQPWVDALGSVSFASLTRAQIVAALMSWHQLSVGTRNHRLSALRVLWRTVAPDDAPHACERVKRLPATRPSLNRARPMALVQLVLDHVAAIHPGGADSHAKVQLTLLAWMGHGAATIARIRPAHVRWDTEPPEVYLQPRRKGSGADAAWLPLLPQAADALKAWLALGVTAPWHRGVLRKAWQRAIVHTQAELRQEGRHAEADLLAGMRVYDLRHSFLTALAVESKNLDAVRAYAQHANVSTTLGYMRGASPHNVRAAVAALSESLQTAQPDSLQVAPTVSPSKRTH